MSDAPAVPPSPAATPPPRTRFQWFVAFIRTGWRPAAGWTCVLILVVNGAVLPIARLCGVQLEPLNWRELSMFVGSLVALAGLRSAEKITGAAE